jgi:hypothetical protein
MKNLTRSGMSSVRSLKGGDAEDDDAETIEEVFAKLLFADGGFEVTMSGG